MGMPRISRNSNSASHTGVARLQHRLRAHDHQFTVTASSRIALDPQGASAASGGSR
jgi:hypothetical protein